jgi:hypothetical protein
MTAAVIALAVTCAVGLYALGYFAGRKDGFSDAAATVDRLLPRRPT